MTTWPTTPAPGSLEARQTVALRTADPDNLLACLRTGTDLAALTPRPVTFAVPGVLPEGFVVVAGAPKRGKSWLMLDCCLAVAAGGMALGAI